MNAIEKQITRKIVEALIADGNKVAVDYDRGYENGLPASTDVDAIIEACDAVDECWLFVKTGWVYLIWGNGNGMDCISDYTLSLEPIIDGIIE